MTKDEWVSTINSNNITYTTESTVKVTSTDVKKETNTVTSIGRTDIGVTVYDNIIEQTASSNINITYNLSYTEALFVDQVTSGYDIPYTLEEAICLLDIAKVKDGNIEEAEIKSIVGNRFYNGAWGQLSTSDCLSLFYATSKCGVTVAEVEYMMTQERLAQVYNLMNFQALCMASNVNLKIGSKQKGSGFTIKGSKGTVKSAKIPRTGAEWNEYFKSKYGSGNVEWVTELKSYNDITMNPKALWGKSADEVGKILGKGWTRGTYGSAGTGWKFTNGDKSVFYHAGGGVHEGSYVGVSSGQIGKVKVVGSDYKPLIGDKAIIIRK